MTEYRGPDSRRNPWKAPKPYGYGPASASALFIAAPLFTAAALSLAGVVGGADDEFRWPGPILLILVIAALILVASIQLAYYARLHLYSYDDLVTWLGPGYVEDYETRLRSDQKRDQKIWTRYQLRAVHAFNVGTMLLGVGVAAALVPPVCGEQPKWRWAAAAVVCAATVIDAIWVTYMHMKALNHRTNWFYRSVRGLIEKTRRERG
ncbi:hypothetical protein ACFY94_37830 [Streptomyces griseorubiginosus]|uniref:hypothetical protein n=1 Tax=Streptomyces griseorubiginosus TaxID=67304 RepID=UPI0036E11BCB